MRPPALPGGPALPGSVALSGSEELQLDRPEWARSGIENDSRPIGTARLRNTSVQALGRPQQAAATERLDSLNMRWVKPGWPGRLAELREHAAAIRRETLADLEGYVTRLTGKVEAAGGVVHRAAGVAEAREIVAGIVASSGARLVIKSKSMATEEIELNHRLSDDAVEVVETDLGEYIVQLAGERPSHILAPAVHKSAAEVASLFAQLGYGGSASDATEMAGYARDRLREDFHNAGLGITGVNFAAADTGTLALVTNEGNGRMVTSQPRVQIAVMGLDKVIPRFSDLVTLLPLVTQAATREKLSVYQSLTTGPRKPGEVDGPEELHLVLLDNGRSRIAGGSYSEVLACIRCGACQVACPVYRTIGGHAYLSTYAGPIGAVLSPLLDEPGAHAAALPFLSSLCGACLDACPVKIPLPDMLVKLRADYERGAREVARAGVEAATRSRLEEAAWRAWAGVWRYGEGFAGSARLARLASLVPPRLLGRLPGPGRRWAAGRELPDFSEAGTFRRWAAARAVAISGGEARDLGVGAGGAPSLSEATSPGPGAPEPGNEPLPEPGLTGPAEPAGLGAVPRAAERMVAQMRDAGIEAEVLASPEEAVDRALAICAGRAIATEDHPDLAGLRDLLDGKPVAGHPFVVSDPWEASIGVTGVEMAVVETGTLVLTASGARPRSTSLVPPVYVALVPEDRIVETLERAYALLGELSPKPSCITFVSGPSKSADIEMRLVRGVHGPGEVHVLVYPG
ncbi:MAG: LUD domain-containing protein [Acidimicrobiales bacterium]